MRETFSAFGPVTFARVQMMVGAPKTGAGYECNAAVVGFQFGADAAMARASLDGEELLGPGKVGVAFKTGHQHDVDYDTDEELDDATDEYDMYENDALDSPGDMEFDDDNF